MDINKLTASSDKLLKESEQFLKDRVIKEPTNIEYLSKLANVYREEGKLKESLGTFRKILELDPSNEEAILMIAIFTNKPIINLNYSDPMPTPFVKKNAFLSQKETYRLWETIVSKQNKFTTSLITAKENEGHLNKKTRSSTRLAQCEFLELSRWFLNKILKDAQSVSDLLGIEAFHPSEIEIEIARHGNGDFFNIHTDTDYDKFTRTRTLTFVYYFYRMPKPFDKGEIILFDTDRITNINSTRYTRLHPENNSIIFFPSNFYHQVVPVQLENDTFENGRFSIHGWMHKKDH